MVGHILTLAEGESATFAIGCVGIGDTGGGHVEIEVDSTVAAVSYVPSLVIVAGGAEGLSIPSYGEHSLTYR